MTGGKPRLYTAAVVGTVTEAPEEKARGKAPRRAVWAWVLYDFSNTIFSVSILSVFFPLWLGDELGAGAGAVNLANAAMALLVVLTAPALGAVADFRQRRVPYLVLFTLLAVALTVGLDLSAGYVPVAVALFVAAGFTYQSALVFYNALLPVVAEGRGIGRISGYGTAVGYIGSIIALVVLNAVFVSQAGALRGLLGPLGGWVDTGGQLNSNAFLPTAVAYLVFSLPAFFLIPDRAVRPPRRVRMGTAYGDVLRTVRSLVRGGNPAYAGMGTFILATVLYTDAANTAVANMALYGREVLGMGGGEITTLLAFSTTFAVVGAALVGAATDRFGPKRTLAWVLVLWFFAIVLASTAVAPWMLYLAGPLVGIALGGTWTSSRVLLVALSPPDKLGEFFGLYSIAGKFSAVTGPLIVGLLLRTLGDGALAYRISVGLLAVVMALGLAILLRVPDARPRQEP
jgi:UMF1 family MFS transporter